MAYFPNSTAFDHYSAQYCQHCVHGGKHNDEHYICPIQTLHLLYNYEACNDKDHIIHMLIPMDKTENKECTMFKVADDGRCTVTPDFFEGV